MKYEPGDMKKLSSAEVSSCRLLSDNFDCPPRRQLVPWLHIHTRSDERRHCEAGIAL